MARILGLHLRFGTTPWLSVHKPVHHPQWSLTNQEWAQFRLPDLHMTCPVETASQVLVVLPVNALRLGGAPAMHRRACMPKGISNALEDGSPSRIVEFGALNVPRPKIAAGTADVDDPGKVPKAFN